MAGYITSSDFEYFLKVDDATLLVMLFNHCKSNGKVSLPEFLH